MSENQKSVRVAVCAALVFFAAAASACSSNSGGGAQRAVKAPLCGLNANSAAQLAYSGFYQDSINGVKTRAGIMPCPVTVRTYGENLSVKTRISLDCRRVGTLGYDPNKCNNGLFVQWNVNRRGNPVLLSATGVLSIGKQLGDTGWLTTASGIVSYASNPSRYVDSTTVNGDSLHFAWTQTTDSAWYFIWTAIGKDSLTGFLTGPATVATGGTGAWILTTDRNPSGYAVSWSVDGMFATDTNAVFGKVVSGTSPKTVSATYTTASGYSQTVSKSITLQLNGAIAGTGEFSDPGTYTWTAGATGATGVSPSYSWWAVADGTGATTQLGSASSATRTTDGTIGSFTLYLTVSAPGYASASTSKHIHGGAGCNGGFCLVAPQAPRKEPESRRAGRLYK